MVSTHTNNPSSGQNPRTGKNRGPSFRHSTAWKSRAILAGFILLAAFARLHTYQEPLERDITQYAIYAHEMLQGQRLYSDLWEQRPPLIYAAYAMAEKITGFGQQEAYFLWLLAFIATIPGIYRIGSAGRMGETGGLWAGLYWTVIASDMLLQANQPNAEVFMNACAVWTFAFLLGDPLEPREVWKAGIFLALGTMFKPQMGLIIVFFPFAAVLFISLKKKFRRFFETAFPLVVPSILLWVLFGVYLAFTGRLGIFTETVFGYGYYSGNIFLNLWQGLKPAYFCPDFLGPLIPLVLLAGAGILLGSKEHRRQWLLFFSLIAGTYLVVACTGQFFPHYYQLWLPYLAVGGGWGACLTLRRMGRFSGLLKPLPALLCLFLLLAHELPTYALTADEWSQRKYGDAYLQGRRLGGILGQILGPHESFFIWGDNASVYFYSQKMPPTGVFIVATALSGPMAPSLGDRLLTDLAQKKPDMVICDESEFPGYYRHFLNKYRIWKYYPQNGKFILMVQKGGELEKRLGIQSGFTNGSN